MSGAATIVRVLAIRQGKTRDGEGRCLGDDLLLADFGLDGNGTTYSLTTDHVRGSELADLEEALGLGPKELAEAIAKNINQEYRRRLSLRRSSNASSN